MKIHQLIFGFRTTYIRTLNAHKRGTIPLLAASLLAGCGGAVVEPSSSDVAVSSVSVVASSSLPVVVSSSLAAVSSSSLAVVSSTPAVSSIAPSSIPKSSSSIASSSSASTVQIPAGSTLVYAINAGGPALTIGGIDYKADNFSTGGTELTTTDAIAGTTNDALYQSFRWGKYKYEVPVTNSTYSVALNFAEMYHTVAAGRYFSVTVEGQPVFTDKDLFADVGAKTAYDINVPNVMVADGKLTIELTASLDNGTLSAFAIYSNVGGKFVEPVTPPPPPPGETCDLPTNLSWTDSGVVIAPKNGDVAVKDPSIVQYDNKYYVFATTVNAGYKSMYTTFTDLAQAGAGTYGKFSPGGSSTVAPQAFFFKPQNKWYIFTQWPAKYTTNTDITNVNGWAKPTTLWPGNDVYGGALDFWVICDDANCFIYFFKDDGKMYYSKTTIANFPKFDVNQVKVATVAGSGGQSILFEAGNVYKVKGTNKYILMVEGWGSAEGRRLYRAWTSTSLDGPWVAYKTTENAPFAGINNVTFSGTPWSQQISHGEMVRSGYDEKMEIDACNMQFLYQGVNLSGYSGSYDNRPYKLGLLKAKK